MNQTEEQIVIRILSGEAYKDIASGTGVAISTIKKIKKRNLKTFWEQDAKNENSLHDEMKLLISRANQTLSRKLDKEGDSMSVRDLLYIIKTMNKQTAINLPLRGNPKVTDSELQKYL